MSSKNFTKGKKVIMEIENTNAKTNDTVYVCVSNTSCMLFLFFKNGE